MSQEEFDDKLKRALSEIQGSSAYSLERDRPYDAQPHTSQGERGKRMVEGLTMRDIADCMVRGFLYSADPDQGLHDIEMPIRDDLYKVDLSKVDPGAVIQNTTCWIEKYMGIFPNVPKAQRSDDECQGCHHPRGDHGEEGCGALVTCRHGEAEWDQPCGCDGFEEET